MIQTLYTPNLAQQLAINSLAFLLSQTSQSRVQYVELGYSMRTPSSRGEAIIGTREIIDGEWPRLKSLNLPLPARVETFKCDYPLFLAGPFGDTRIFVPYRKQLKDLFAPRQTKNSRMFKRLVCVKEFSPNTNKALGILRPTPEEILSLPHQTCSQDTLVISLNEALQPHNRYQHVGFKTLNATPNQLFSLSNHAEELVAVLSPLAWWLLFVTDIKSVTWFDFGDYHQR